ncbi:YhgE/Pip family protein [Nocardia sp. NPDC127579]|uniref:YhgE/Pip family protein n=1 Tax=Nocardia sp. NPDC127579 TaxID=3345402 RepID=UPI0036351749
MSPTACSPSLFDWLRRRNVVRRSRLTVPLVVLVLIVPTLISAVYMWVLWDPSNYLRRIPVAVANEDTGIVVDGAHQNIGAEIVDDLTAGGDLAFHRVSGAEAIEGLRQNRFTFSVVIPAGFTADVRSVTDARPAQARIMVYYNDFNGTYGSTVAEMVLAQARQQIAGSIGKEYATEALVGLNNLADGLGAARTGAAQLAAGTSELATGTRQLTDGLDAAGTGVAQLSAGTGQLRAGTGEIAAGAAALRSGTDELGVGATQLRDGIDQALGPVLAALSIADGLTTDLTPVLDRLAASDDRVLVDAAGRLRLLLDQVGGIDPDRLAGQLRALSDGTRELARQLTDPNAEYRAGVSALADGSGQLSRGAVELDNGMSQLSTGLAELADGGRQLHAGVGQLDAGARELESGLGAGAARAPHIADVEASAAIFGEPVRLDAHNQQPAQVVVDGDLANKELAQGSGPLVVLLAVFLTVIVAWMLFAPVARNVTGTGWPASALALLRRTWIVVGAGIAAALLAAAHGASVGWSPQNWPTMLVLVAFIGTVAGIIAQLFVTVLGRFAGSLAAFAFFMFQLFAFGGVYPAGTTPTLFRPIGDIAPMTYARRAMLRCDLGLYDQMFWTSVAVLAVMAALGFGAAVCTHRLVVSANGLAGAQSGSDGRA